MAQSKKARKQGASAKQVTEREVAVEVGGETEVAEMDGTIGVAVEVTEVPATTERVTIKSVIVNGIRAGLGTKDIAALVRERFPESAAARKSEKHIAWYRSKLRQEAKIAANAAQAATANQGADEAAA